MVMAAITAAAIITKVINAIIEGVAMKNFSLTVKDTLWLVAPSWIKSPLHIAFTLHEPSESGMKTSLNDPSEDVVTVLLSADPSGLL